MADLRYPPIGDYAVIGDCRTAALVSRSGGLDWLCLPRFDSPALFSSLLDRERGGTFRISPAAGHRAERRYVGETNVLETTFFGSGGKLTLLDVMPVAGDAEVRNELRPDHEIIRRIECVEGDVEVEVVFDPRPDFGRRSARWHRDGPFGFVCEHGSDVLVLRTDAPLSREGGPGVRGRFTLRAGQTCTFALSYGSRHPLILPDLAMASPKIERSLKWWEEWSDRCTYRGDYRSAVVRSALALKLLTYAPSGAIVAAPTTSLPEKLGGVRNWDYRYCWLRDSALTLRALFDIGYVAEGEAFLGWLLHTTHMTWPELQVLYDVYGEMHIGEQQLDHLVGYAGSRPVRVGNAAVDQLQLDIYGKVVDAACLFVERGGQLDRSMQRMVRGLGETVCRRWREPDEGIWEIRLQPRHHTLSKAMCWVALDRLLWLHRNGFVKVDGVVLDRFRQERKAIRQAVESEGYDEELGSYVHAFGHRELDASLLLLPLYGYAPADSPRVLSTCDRIRDRLGRGPLIYRYREVRDGLPPGEGAFGICSFWSVETLALAGRLDEAVEAFEALVGYANDVGLFAEEIDPDTGQALGNFPQGFTHIGLIDAALTLSQRLGEMPRLREPGHPRDPGVRV